eukprot:2512306-Amphidinium_carterae.1
MSLEGKHGAGRCARTASGKVQQKCGPLKQKLAAVFVERSSVGWGRQEWLLCVQNGFLGSSRVLLQRVGKLEQVGVDVKQHLLHRVLSSGQVLALSAHVAGENLAGCSENRYTGNIWYPLVHEGVHTSFFSSKWFICS